MDTDYTHAERFHVSIDSAKNILKLKANGPHNNLLVINVSLAELVYSLQCGYL